MSDNLLLVLKASRLRNHSLLQQRMYFYSDHAKYRKPTVFSVHEVTFTYNQIAKVDLHSGILYADMVVYTSDGQEVKMKWIVKPYAKKAKKLIDKKLRLAHTQKHETFSIAPKQQKNIVKEVEKNLHRLEELKMRGKITAREYKAKRKEMLKKLHE